MSVLTTILFCFLFHKNSVVVSDPIRESQAVFTLYQMARAPCTDTKTAPDVVCYTAVFSVVTQRSSSLVVLFSCGEEHCVTTLKTAV